MNTIIAILIFILGTTIGSFLSVVIYRTKKKKKGILASHSICPSCRKPLKWRHLIPVFSWLFLRGKCGYCGKKISIHYFLLEIFTGLLFLLSYLHFNFLESASSLTEAHIMIYSIDYFALEQFIYAIIIFSLLTLIFFYDLQYKEIPDRFSLPAIGIALAGGLVFQSPSVSSMLIGGGGILLFFLIQFLLSKGTWIGGGDLRLGLLMGVFLGWQHGLLALILAYIIGALISIVLLIQKKVKRKTAIPFGPFLVTGTIIAFFVGDFIIDYYLNLLSF